MSATRSQKQLTTVIREILANAGTSVDELAVNEPLEIDGGSAFMDLEIEKVWDDAIRVGHYRVQRMDQISDPAVTIRVEDGGGLTVVEYEAHTGIHPIHEQDKNGIADPGINDMLQRWAKNLRTQGHVERAKEHGE
jgi:hypothetical protein